MKQFPDESEFVTAYQIYLDHICENVRNGNSDFRYYITEHRYEDIYKTMIKSGVFDILYPTDTLFVDPNTGRITNFERSDSIFRIQSRFRRDGKYAELLLELSSIDTIYFEHYKSLEIAGEMMPFNIGLLTCEYGRYDLNDPKVQLFYMITLLEPGWRFSQSLCDTQ